ncbi:MAG: HNH endonuclease signature motif containing protein [Deltaproteobacteria bacterium]|nr:HNH endonuclease signature motif containing protein [Deltaproteobacteria bacterium]
MSDDDFNRSFRRIFRSLRPRSRRRKYTAEELDKVYDRTDGRCHICTKKRDRQNYAREGLHGWQVDHSKPIARGGTDSPQNWRMCCTGCNAAKGTMSARRAREEHGSRSPVSAKEVQRQRAEMVRSAVLGAAALGCIAWYQWDLSTGVILAVAALALGIALALNFDPND